MDQIDLLDWKRQIAELYAAVRAEPDAARAHDRWRAAREELFRSHPQSPIPEDERRDYGGPFLYDYDPRWRLLAEVSPAPAERFELPSSDGATMAFTRFATAHADEVQLDLYWLEGYGGGLFVPFADATSGGETYGAGRYVLDTVKGADLGVEDRRLVLDLNFAFQPSCSYDPRWTCPLAPPANRLAVEVRSGERLGAG